MLWPGFRGLPGMLALLALLAPAGCRQQSGTPVGGPIIRVCLHQNVDRVEVAATTTVIAKSAAEAQARRLNLPSGSAVLVALAPQGWVVGNVVMSAGNATSAGELTLSSQSEGAVRVNGRAYRGQYRFVPTAPGKFDVVNDVPVESYLKGVLPAELPAAWGIEAYKAQAITARTYALYELRTRPEGRHFDVFDDTRSQVYDGLDRETAKSQRATDETAGIVVAYGQSQGKERIFKAYFSSCCGGVGQSVTDAFNEDAIPPMVEQSVGALCNASPKFNWPPIVLSKTELTRRINGYGARRSRPERDMAMLARIDIETFNQFGRPVRFVFTDARGVRYSMSGEETRWACNFDAQSGAPTLPSSFFKPVNEPEVVRFTDGHGFGHGVGLCQWCSQARSEQGMRHEDIVLLAYPRAKLIRAY
jgi:stage II sporulation protein D